ncbi:hypothetical protein ACFQ60_42160 [Streptomyces zhihengii]
MLLDLSGSETRGAGTASATVTATLTPGPPAPWCGCAPTWTSPGAPRSSAGAS